MKDTIMTICAHNDDQIIGAGGTLAKYAEQGKNVVTVIFSYGESSHPHYRPEVTRKIRKQETVKANEILGCGDIIHFGVKEKDFMKEIEKKRVKKKIRDILAKYKPSKIFTHSADDPHPNHKDVHNTLLEVIDKIKYKGDVYNFNVWTPLTFRGRDKPRMIVNITKTFDKKIDSFKANESQTMTMITLMWNVYFQAFWLGLSNGVRFAEVFYKIR